MDMIDSPVSVGDITIRPLDAPLGAEVRCGPLDKLSPDERAIVHQAWLDHLILVFPGQDLSPEELAVLKKFYVKLAKLAENDDDVHTSHSLDEADDRHQVKLAGAEGARGPKRRAKRSDKSEKK